MIINHNMNAMNAHRSMMANGTNSAKSMEKLSTGLRINRAGDDAAGLTISEKMRGQIRGLDQGSRNAQDSISLIQTAEGGLTETHSILQRMRELAVQGSNDTNTTTDRTAIQGEVTQLTNEINRIANTTEFNTKKLLNGELEGVQSYQTGAVTQDFAFANGNVAFSQATNFSTALATDVIRINVLNNVSNAQGFSQMTISVSSVLGTFSTSGATCNFVATSQGILISQGGSNGTAITDLSINFANVSLATSGDSITLTINKQVAAKTDSSKQIRAQIGANSGQELGIGINAMTSSALGVQTVAGASIDVTNQAGASGAVALINNAITRVSAERSKLGSFQNRLEHTITNLDASSENLQSSESRIRDVDMAAEMMTFSKNNILSQAAQAMLAQANQQPQGVLQLLR